MIEKKKGTVLLIKDAMYVSNKEKDGAKSGRMNSLNLSRSRKKVQKQHDFSFGQKEQ